MLPISSQRGEITTFGNALFTATSAVCVTGLVVYDTATYWSYFGQTVILILIQVGGLGVISVGLVSFYDCRKKNQFNATSDHAKCTLRTTGWWCCQADTIPFFDVICN